MEPVSYTHLDVYKRQTHGADQRVKPTSIFPCVLLSWATKTVKPIKMCIRDRLNPEQHYFEEYYASYSDVPTESLDKLSSQKLLALWMEFEQHAEHETRLGLLQKLSIMFRFNRNALKLFLHSPELVIPYLQSQFYSCLLYTSPLSSRERRRSFSACIF